MAQPQRDLTTRTDHAQAVAQRMVERACWLMSLEESYVSEDTRQKLLEDTTDMLLGWAYEVGDESFRAGDFSTRTA